MITESLTQLSVGSLKGSPWSSPPDRLMLSESREEAEPGVGVAW